MLVSIRPFHEINRILHQPFHKWPFSPWAAFSAGLPREKIAHFWIENSSVPLMKPWMDTRSKGQTGRGLTRWYRLAAGGREQLEALLEVVVLEGEGLFDPLVMHGDVTDAVHQAETPAPQIHPEFVGLAVNCLADPVHVENPENVPVPKVGCIKSDPVLQHGRGLRYHVVSGRKRDVVF